MSIAMRAESGFYSVSLRVQANAEGSPLHGSISRVPHFTDQFPGFPASLINPWVRSGSGPASPGRVCPEPEGPIPAFVTWKSSSPPAGIEPGSMTIGPQGSNQ
ncbi:hypothetical protein F2Q70_00031080 [Brassica cretica]|uniref:Uncharacterized protein n=1 Tax=Brassica cretica TaxID=69181 RepID=A0A8S9FH82_BRACR|nr:hypothetical protein F2Q70_00031080 [Brassica cretica]